MNVSIDTMIWSLALHRRQDRLDISIIISIIAPLLITSILADTPRPAARTPA